MRAVIQRVDEASVSINNSIHAAIANGLLVLVGIEEADMQEDIAWLSTKLVNLRIFDDTNGVMNLDLKENGGGLLLISQFTLLAATKKGNRPSYSKAARPAIAVPLYKQLILQLEKDLGKPIGTGVFGADMKVQLVNAGPVTIIIDTKNKA
jgi:D-aminoacyl-tRNA deacylase